LDIESHQFFGQVSVTAGNGFDPGPSHAGPKKTLQAEQVEQVKEASSRPPRKHLVERLAEELGNAIAASAAASRRSVGTAAGAR
jgi:hypothetical protein